MKRAKIISSILDHYFKHPKIPLKHQDPYTLLIAVLLSAQCTDERVNKITPKLFKIAPTPEKMIALSQAKLETLIHSCGLFRSKAKNILALSHALIKKYRGKVPQNFKALEDLPGIGHKSASVVLVQAFNKAAFPVDTHIYRSARRWQLSAGKTPLDVEKDLKKLFPKKEWGKRHLQIIYFARKFCHARGHKVEQCPICAVINDQSDIARISR